MVYMNNIKGKIVTIYKDNSLLINISISVLVLLIVLTILNSFFTNTSNNQEEKLIKITLFGNNLITINQGEEYVEPGFYAINESGEIKTNLVKVSGQVNSNKPGTYQLVYEVDNIKVVRTIQVIKKEETETSKLNFSLIGNSLMIINQGQDYKEPGYIASIDNRDISGLVEISGSVNTMVPGTYKLTYTVTVNDLVRTLTREIVVNSIPLNVSVTKNTTDYTNKDILLTFVINGTNYSYIKFPDNTISKTKNPSYTIKENGTYNFYIYDTANNYVLKEITITNIDKQKPTGTCTAKVLDGKTTMTILATDKISGIKEYEFYGDNNYLTTKTNNNYVHNAKLKTAYAMIFDKSGNSSKVTCDIKIEDLLEVHYINVGSEDAILIRNLEKTILIDGGSYSTRDTVTPYLKELGVKKIDTMIGSHLHYNHIQAQADILENFEVGDIYYPQDLRKCYEAYCDTRDQQYILSAIKKYNKTISILEVNDSIDIGNINIFAIGPIQFQTLTYNKYRQNYNSSNFILTFGDTKFMFTGDYMQSANIMKKFSSSILNIDVLKYPHHGNCTLSESLINAMSPTYTIITSSNDKLSSRKEKKYLENVGSKFYYSYKNGNIVVLSDGKNLTVKTNVNPSDYKR